MAEKTFDEQSPTLPRTRVRRYDAPRFGSRVDDAADTTDEDVRELSAARDVESDEPEVEPTAQRLPAPPPVDLDDNAITAAFLRLRGWSMREVECILTGPCGCRVGERNDKEV